MRHRFGFNRAGVDWIDIALEEYRTLREESLAAIAQAQGSLQLGLTAIGVVTAFAALKDTDVSPFADVCLACAAPLIAARVGVVRAFEVKRAVVAGSHNARLEQAINRSLDQGLPEALSWESDAADTYGPKDDGSAHGFDTAVLATLYAASLPSVAIELSRLHSSRHHVAYYVLIGAVIVLVATVAELGRRRTMTAIDDARRGAAEVVAASRQQAPRPSR